MRTDITPTSAVANRRRNLPPDHWQLASLPWTLFAASFTRTAPNEALRRLLMRDGEAMRAAGVTPPEPIGPRHEIEGFDCGEPRLNELLQRSAALTGFKSPQELGSAQPHTFVAVEGRRVVAFYTARLGSLSPAAGPASDIVPVSIVSHFAVDRRWQDGTIAADLLWHVVRKAYTAAPSTGSRALFGYAINRRVKRLYMRLGARALPNLIHPLATMISFADVADAIRDDQTEPKRRVTDETDYGMNTRVVRSEGAVQAEADGRVIAFNIQKGRCYEFNSVAAQIWTMLNRPTRIGTVCDQLIAQYDVEPKNCQNEVLALLTELRGISLVEALPSGHTIALDPR